MEFVKKICRVCNKDRKFLKDSDRDKASICGQCWNWSVSVEENLKIIGTPKTI